jgi:hypothetical protein
LNERFPTYRRVFISLLELALVTSYTRPQRGLQCSEAGFEPFSYPLSTGSSEDP